MVQETARLYVGPWVEFKVPAGRDAPEAAGALVGLHPPVADPAAPRTLRFVPGLAKGTAINPPPKRRMLYSEADVEKGLRMDLMAATSEKAWLFALYAEDVHDLRETLGADPVVGWGVLRAA